MHAIRKILRDIVPTSVRKQIIHCINTHSGNYINRPIYGKVTYNEDGFATTHNSDFKNDAQFSAAYAAGKATGSWTFGDLRWRAYIVCWAAERGAKLEGDFVECGVNRGGYALAVIKYINFEMLKKKFYLLDTYKGVVEQQITPEEKAAGVRAGEYEDCYEAVTRTFSSYGEQVKIIKGIVPDTLQQVDAEKIAFLSIDMNTRDPEIAAAKYFWHRLVSGAVIVLDDYGWRKHIEQKKAFDDFAKERGTSVLVLPTGQGLIFKP
ncbi:TylF/MycF/NovP-related O-methyltransferase [Desulfogranum japonicum]|uniref:TylF/MycF/NovP-related O-methyltransferase n=1 Tax=Desulfogranum japonicum TaxID=231447 RepID=UPI0004126EC5|nr:TylF/MycF/NovP-related O-methyltransferase [Desulfogranum japonicum]